MSNDVHAWIDNLENVSPDQKDTLKEFPEEVLIYAKKSFLKTSSIAFPFKWLNKVCENYQTSRPTKSKSKQPHELTGKAKIWAENDYDLPPTVTPFVTFEENEKKWQEWLQSQRGQNYRLLYGDYSVNKAYERYATRAREWHDNPEGCVKVVTDFQKGIVRDLTAVLKEPSRLNSETMREQSAAYFKALSQSSSTIKEPSNLDGDERKDIDQLLGFGDL